MKAFGESMAARTESFHMFLKWGPRHDVSSVYFVTSNDARRPPNETIHHVFLHFLIINVCLSKLYYVYYAMIKCRYGFFKGFLVRFFFLSLKSRQMKEWNKCKTLMFQPNEWHKSTKYKIKKNSSNEWREITGK